MHSNDLYAVESLDPQSTPYGDRMLCLPQLAIPLPDEALPAWMFRFADSLEVTPEALLLEPFDTHLRHNPSWWRKPDPLVLKRLSARTGESITQLELMILKLDAGHRYGRCGQALPSGQDQSTPTDLRDATLCSLSTVRDI